MMTISSALMAQEPVAPLNPAGTPLTARPARPPVSTPAPTAKKGRPTPPVPTPAPTVVPPAPVVPTPAVQAIPTPTAEAIPAPTAEAAPTPAPAPEAPSAPEPVRPPRPAPARSLPAPAANEMIPFIDFPNTPVGQVLEFYESLTGKKALYNTTVQGNIHVRVTKPVTKAEAIRILETVLALNNFTLVPGPGDIVRVLNTGNPAKQFPIPIFTELEALPENNTVVTFLFRLENADPQEVKNALMEVIGATPGVTNIVALPKSQTVLMTDYSDVIRNVAPVVATLDCKPAEVVSLFFPLERADAKEVVEKLTKMFEKSPNQGGTITPGAPPPGTPPGTPGASRSVTLSEDSLIVGKIKIEADLRTNRIHVVTRPVNLPFLRSLINDLDAGLPLGEPATRPLRFVLAGDVLDIVANAVADPGVKVENIGGGGRGGGAASPVSNPTGSLGSNSPMGTSSGSSRRGSTNSSGITAGPYGSQHGAQQTDTAPEGRIIRNTRIIADNRINAIIVVGNKEVKAKVFRLLDQIDVRAPQVMLTAVIGELSLNNDEQFGVDYLLHRGNLASVLGTGSSVLTGSSANIASALGLPVDVPGLARNNGVSLRNIISASSLPGGVSGLIGVSNSLDILVSALESTGRFRVTSRPMIFTSNNRAAVISSGESIPVPSSINSTYANGSLGSLVTQANVDYIDVGLKLSVLPLINSEGEVTLQISQEANNTGDTVIIGGNAIYKVTTRSVDTTVSVANEATVVLGGLVSEQKSVTNSGIPGLHRLPLVGPLFGFKKKTVNRTELIVLIRPTVTMGPVDAVKAGERAIEKTNLPPDLDASLDPLGTHVKTGAPTTPFIAPKPLLRPEK